MVKLTYVTSNQINNKTCDFFFIERNKNCERRLASREREREQWEGVGPVGNERSERERERERK